jgi:DNA-binding MarR family transcriptional regulator
MNFEHLHLKNQICHRLYIATNGVTRLYRPLLEALNLTYPQYILMMALWEVEEASILELQKLTKIDSGSLTLILKKLQTKKFVKIKTASDDKRKKIVSLTARGFELKEKSTEVPGSAFCNINNLTNKDVADLVKILDKLNSDILDS